jgi:nucleoside-diphosphate-sugar epimerase
MLASNTIPLATVIGAQGFIGRALVDVLRDAGWSCWMPDRHQIWPQMGRNLGHIFYCAGLTSDYLDRPADTVAAHIGLLTNVLQSSAYDSLVYLSSTRLYDGLTPGSLANEELTLPLAPHLTRHFYDLTKLTGESLCHVMGNGKARVARLSCVYQSASDGNGFLPSLIRQVSLVARNAHLQVNSSPHFSRDYVHVADVISALIAIATQGTQLVYNVAGGHNLRNDELAQFFFQACGRIIDFELDQSASNPPLIDISRLSDEFNWWPMSVQDRIGPLMRSLPD